MSSALRQLGSAGSNIQPSGTAAAMEFATRNPLPYRIREDQGKEEAERNPHRRHNGMHQKRGQQQRAACQRFASESARLRKESSP